MNIDSRTCKEFRQKANEALKSVADEMGFDLTIGNISFSSVDFSTKIKGTLRMTKSGITGQQKKFEQLCGRYGLKKEHYGATFMLYGNVYRVIEFNTKARKYPVVCETLPEGVRQRISATDCLRYLELNDME